MLKLPFEFTMGEYASNTYYKDTYNNNIIFQLTVDCYMKTVNGVF